jgi:HPt (histidine-containing phosphotransfer) domain-containing protein
MAGESQNPSRAPSPHLASEFAHDADMADVIEFFLSDLQARIATLERAWQAQDRTEIGEIAHQVRGAAAGCGYPAITRSAADLEAALNARQAEASSIAEKIESLIALCRKAVGNG